MCDIEGMLGKTILYAKTVFRNVYANLLCNQTCLLCGNNTDSGYRICRACFLNELDTSLSYRLHNDTRYCKKCGRFLISEKDYCNACRFEFLNNNFKNKYYERIYSIFPYQGIYGKMVTSWKNLNIRSFAEIFAEIVFKFISEIEELQNIPIVPVPPRPKKIKNKGWDQIEDTVVCLEHIYKFPVLRCLKRLDGVSQKELSLKERVVNLNGKILLNNKKKYIPDTIIILDDVMTTGTTLNYCSKVLKEAGCKTVYGVCFFFD